MPEAVPRTLQGVADRLGATSLDRVWLFPPRVHGRKESGLIVVSRFAEASEASEAPRRNVLTAAYVAERTGRGLVVDWTLDEQGTAPPDRLPPVVDGVVRRAGDEGPAPTELAVGGDAAVLREWFAACDEQLLDPALWPCADPPAPPPSGPDRGPDPLERSAPTEEAEPA